QKDPEPGRLSLPVTVVNSYAYAGNSPLKLTDPSGRSFLGDFFFAVLVTAAAVITSGAAIGLLGVAGTGFAPFVGAIAGAVGGAIAGGIMGGIGYGVQGRSVAEGFAHGGIKGAILGAAVGFVAGFSSWIAGKNPVAQPRTTSANSTGEINAATDSTPSRGLASQGGSTGGDPFSEIRKLEKFAEDGRTIGEETGLSGSGLTGKSLGVEQCRYNREILEESDATKSNQTSLALASIMSALFCSWPF
ncbi:MAG: hypothetical protein AABZ55_02365, partial [Bdellovibrionota bacterium]